jgi:IclR family mhp operon transcriptional activator
MIDRAESPTAVRSVARTLDILQELNRRAVSSIDQLHRATSLPKPTIVRLLKTLVAAGFVTNDRRQGGYQVTARVQSLSCGFHGDPLVVEAARACAIGVTRRLKWPLAIGLLDRDAVVIRFNTIPDSPISPFYATLNLRLSLVSRAHGRAYLAFCSREEREFLVSILKQSTNPEALVQQPRRLEAILAQVRQQRFAEPDPSPETKNTSTVAVPIMSEDRVLATLGLSYFTSAVSRAVVVAEYLPLLHEAVRSIESHILSMSPFVERD